MSQAVMEVINSQLMERIKEIQLLNLKIHKLMPSQ